MNPQLRAALAAAAIYTEESAYCIIHLPANAIASALSVMAETAAAFSCILVDKDEITLIVAQDLLAGLSERLPRFHVAEGYRLITFDLPLDHGLVGFLAVISRALAEAGIPLMAYSAYERDHLLIQADHYERALQVVQTLREQAQRSA
jgi:hypothetical protein